VHVQDTTTGAAPVAYASTTGTSYTSTVGLTPGHSFAWYVGAAGVNGSASNLLGVTFAGPRNFTLAALAAPVQTDESGTIPVSNGYDTPTFTWTAVTGANHYYLYVQDTTTNTAAVNNPSVSGTSYTFTG